MADTEDADHTVELSLDASEHERLQALDGDPESVLGEALERELGVREQMAIAEARRAGEVDSPHGGPAAGSAPESPVGAMLGWEVVSVGEGEATLAMDAGARFANRGGPVQGGIITALADTATGFAFGTTLEPDESTTNIELKMNFLRPVFEDRLEASATVVNRGRTLGLVECSVRNSEGKLVARLSTTYMVLRGERAEGR
jgi:uncharacterized protein (TIGR00369 family)